MGVVLGEFACPLTIWWRGAVLTTVYSPGRFFAANQMKLTLAHVALYYEIERLESRPENLWFVSSMAPPFSQTIRVRRRKA